MPTDRERYRGALVGLAAGDAVGTTLEFQPRGSFEPIDDMVGGGPFNLKLGQWTDDTSMALCLSASLIHCRGFNAQDQMDRYCDWASNGYMSSTGSCFDIGNTISGALRRYQTTGDPFAGSTHPRSAGNGSLMRLAPVVLFYHPNTEKAVHFSGESSRTTHGATEAIDSCRLFAQILVKVLDGAPKQEDLLAESSFSTSERLNTVARGEYRGSSADSIRGSGYVVDCIEAALWCFDETDDFRSAVLKAANLGDDADTTAAVCGQIAGAYYGIEGIPAAWRRQLTMYPEIVGYADRFIENAV